MPREVEKTLDIQRFPQPRVGADGEIAALAELQHGVVAREQLRGIGLRDGAIEHRLRLGRLHRVHEGVYAVGHRRLTLRGRWKAATLAFHPNGVLSHRSAAALWGIRHPGAGPIHVTTSVKAAPVGNVRRHSSKLLPPDEVTEVDGIPVTIVPRTILDLAAEAPYAVEAALREAEHLRLWDRLSLPDLLRRYPGRRGIRSVRAAIERVAESSGRVRSRLEERFLVFLDRHSLPRPRLNAWLEAGGRRYQVDCLWPEARLIVELDGWESHGTRRAFQADRSRDRRLAAAGYRLTRITWVQLGDEPTAIARDLRHLLRPRG